MCEVEQLSHTQNFIFGVWKLSDFSNQCYQPHIYSSFEFCVIQFCSQFQKLVTGQPKICRIQMYISFLVLIRWKFNVQIHTYFYHKTLLIYYGAILFSSICLISLVFYRYTLVYSKRCAFNQMLQVLSPILFNVP